MKKEAYYKELKDKGFSLVEIVVIIAIMIVLLAVLTPSLLRYTETSRMQKDHSAMDELCGTVQLALADAETFDEACSYAILNNYITYTDSSGVYGAKYTDEEFWAPDGSGEAVTITFNPDENGNYTIANGLVNDMTYGNGSVADGRTAEGLKQCYFNEMGDGKLYHKVEQTFGATFAEKSATYKNSSYTVFIKLDVVNGIKRANVYGEWNGTNLSPDCPASLGSGTNSYTEEEEPEQTKTGGTTQSNHTSSDLQGGGGSSGQPAPSYKKAPCGVDGHTLNDGRDHETVIDCGHYSCECSGCIIPEGGQYTDINGVIYNPGESFPEIVQTGDIYTFKEYEYRYNYNRYHASNNGTASWVVNEEQNGWGVFMYIKRQNNAYIKNPSAILSEINGKPITSLRNTFYDADRITTIPDIPSTVTIMIGTFEGCRSLTDISNLVFPDAVTDLSYTFSTCPSLQTAPILPDRITNLKATFAGCQKMKTYFGSADEDGDFSNYKLPSQVATMSETFENCKAMVSAPIMPNTVRNIQQTYMGCSALVNVPDLPEGIEDVYETFWGCTSLVQAPKLPESTWRIYQGFKGCASLKYIHDFPTTKDLWLSHSFIGCTALETVPVIPKNVVYMGQCFMNCTSLTGDIYINVQKSINEYDCFDGVDFQAQDITLFGMDQYIDGFGATGSNYCAGCNGRHRNANEEHNCHGGISPTCIQQSICMICNNEYGPFGNHIISNEVCTVCGVACLIFETEHNYPNSQNYVVLGNWDYPSAKSVDITIEYETESSSWDWISIVEGNNYSPGSSYSQTKNYLNTSGNIISTTGTNSSVKFGGKPRAIKTFSNVDMLTGSVIFRSDSSGTYWGAKVTITPNY